MDTDQIKNAEKFLCCKDVLLGAVCVFSMLLGVWHWVPSWGVVLLIEQYKYNAYFNSSLLVIEICIMCVCIVLYSLLRFVRRDVLYYNGLCCIVEHNELGSDVLHVCWVVWCVGVLS